MKNKNQNKVIVGTWSLSGDFGYVKKNIVYKTLDTAVKNNFLEFDTAPTYGFGKIHKILSEMFKNDKKIKINTKCGYNANNKKTFKLVDIEKSINKSIKAFGKVHTLFLHNPRDEIKNFDKVINLLDKYKKEGLVKYTGISLARDYYFEKKIMDRFDFLQDELNLLRTNPITFLKNFKPKIMARSPFASGCLTGKLNRNSKFFKSDYRSQWLNESSRRNNILHQINLIKKNQKIPIRILSKNFLFQNKDINKIIFGVKKPLHINEIKKDIINFENIKLNDQEKILKLNKENFYLNDKIGY